MYNSLIERDGDFCYICINKVDERGNAKLIIEHKNGLKDDWEPKNLGLAHQSCNVKKQKLYTRAETPSAEKFHAPILSISNEPSAQTQTQVKDIAEPERALKTEIEQAHKESPQMAVAREKQPEYENWILDNISRDGGLTAWDCIYEGSRQIGIRVATARNYFYQLIAINWIELGKGPRGHKRIFIGSKAPASSEEIERNQDRLKS